MEKTWLEGRIAVESAILGNNREIKNIFIRQGKWKREIKKLAQMAEDASIPVQQAGDAFFNEYATGKSHGGVLAEVGPRQFLEISSLLDLDGIPLIFMLDGVEDPFNFGQAIRTLYAAGASGLIVRSRNWFTAAGIVSRSSAGASELMPTAVVDSALDAAIFLRENGLQIACTAKESAQSIYDVDLSMPLFIVIGGEKRGITRSFLEQSDLVLQIPYGRQFPYSLGTISSTALIAYEAFRQRGIKSGSIS